MAYFVLSINMVIILIVKHVIIQHHIVHINTTIKERPNNVKTKAV